MEHNLMWIGLGIIIGILIVVTLIALQEVDDKSEIIATVEAEMREAEKNLDISLQMAQLQEEMIATKEKLDKLIVKAEKEVNNFKKKIK